MDIKSAAKKISTYMEDHRDEMVGFLTDFVAIKSVTYEEGPAAIDTEHVTTYTGYKIEQEDYFPSWVIPEDHPLIQAGIKTFTALYEKGPVVGAWDFCSNATHLCGRTGIPSIGFGPD